MFFYYQREECKRAPAISQELPDLFYEVLPLIAKQVEAFLKIVCYDKVIFIYVAIYFRIV